MPTGPLRFCLVTPSHVANNPRLVKEADALCAAGHLVRVVAVSARVDLARRDATLLMGRRWRLDVVNVDRRGAPAARWRWLRAGMTQALARRAFDHGARSPRLRDRAASRYLGELETVVSREPADVVIAHNLEALPPAARAAARLGARLGFDVEDLHVEVPPDDAAHRNERSLIRAVEEAYLGRCDLLTASAEGIADEITRRYGVRRPHVVHNVFPIEVARPMAGTTPRADAEVRDGLALYWYSQVIGPGRGLEDAVRAVSLMRRPATIYLRGEMDVLYGARLWSLARELGVESRVRHLPPAAPDDLVALAAGFDVGLALEIPDTLNRALCVTNKLFTYLVAGLAVAATDTPGQRRIVERCGEAAFLYAPGDAVALAAGLERWADSASRLDMSRKAARASAEREFCWERESPALVAFLTDGATAAQRVA